MNSFSQKFLVFIWYLDLLNSRFSLFSERDEKGARIVRVYEMSNIWISAFIEYSEFVDVNGLEVNDKCSESDCSDWDIIISIIDDYVLSEVIGCAWVCLCVRNSNIIVSMFDVEFVYEDFSLSFRIHFPK